MNSPVDYYSVFGPVLSVMKYHGDDHALEIANGSPFGLHGAVWSADKNRAIGFARRKQTGSVDINGASHNSAAPFGGYKQSGIGIEMGREGLEEFLEIKSIQI